MRKLYLRGHVVARFALWGVVLALLVGCASLTGLREKPAVTLVGLDVLEVGLFEQRFALKLRVRNPNEVALPISGLSFDVALNGQAFAHGVSDVAVTVPRYGEAMLDVQATSSLGSLWRQLRELSKGGGNGSRETLRYRISGTLGLKGLGRQSFEHQGEIAPP
jgi:LEA14-like dessication related protein